MHLNRQDKIDSLRKWAASIGPDRLASDVEHLVSLDSEFPDVDIFGPRCVSAQCGQGWNAILRSALKAISLARGKVTQIKQKFGGLKVHWDPYEPPSDDIDLIRLTAEAHGAVASAELLSFATCEHCSSPIDPPRPMSHQTLCDSCTKGSRAHGDA